MKCLPRLAATGECSHLGSQFSLSSVQGRCVEIPPLFSGLLRLWIACWFLVTALKKKKKSSWREWKKSERLSQMIQNKLWVRKLRERDCLVWRRNSEFNFYLQILKKFVFWCFVCFCFCFLFFLVKNVTVQLYTLMTKRGNGLQFVLDTLHGDKALHVVSKGYHSEGDVHPKTFRIYLPKVDRGSN